MEERRAVRAVAVAAVDIGGAVGSFSIGRR